jgi:hypothetical protein
MRLRYLVDLNPFGPLFFNAMNTPCITIADALQSKNDSAPEFVAILSAPPDGFKNLNKEERRKRVDATIRKAVESLSNGNRSITIDFAQAARLPISRLSQTARAGWNLAAQTITSKVPMDWLTAIDILEPSQGVTVGGEGCMDLFLMAAEPAKKFEFEPALVYPVIKGIEMIRWKIPRLNQVILYPYAQIEGEIEPAFKINFYIIEDEKFKISLKSLNIFDALDFDKQIDQRERDIALRKGVNQITAPDLFKHRQSLGLIVYPSVASYLIKHYEKLESRKFKKRNIRTFNRRWYEFIWPRNPDIMLSKEKIITARLFRKGEARFALDRLGIIPQDSCICLSPTSKTAKNFSLLRDQLANVLGRGVCREEVLKYCLAFFNSGFAETQLIEGQRPTPKGFYAITEKNLRRIIIPPPCESGTTAAIIDHVTELVDASDDATARQLEKDLAGLVNSYLKF